VIYDILTEGPPVQGSGVITIVSPEDPRKRKVVSAKNIEDSRLLQPLVVDGCRVVEVEPLTAMRQRTLEDLASFERAILRFDNPHAYATGLSHGLFLLCQQMREHEFDRMRDRLSAGDHNGGRIG